MKTILADVGNSSIKWLNADAEPHALARRTPDRLDLGGKGLDALVDSEPVRWIYISVNRARTEAWLAELRARRPGDDVREIRTRDFRIPNRTTSPARVGVDRVAAATAALGMRTSQRPAVVIDSGTATTVDAINAAGEFLGGAILANPQLSFSSLFEATDALPQLDWEEQDAAPPAIGRNTEEAMMSGAYWGHLGAIRELLHRYEAEWQESPELFFSGAASPAIAKHLSESRERLFPGLVLAGVAMHILSADSSS